MTRMSWPEGYPRRRLQRKTSETQAKRAGPRFAFQAVVLVCALANYSCLVPQSVDAIKEAAHPAPRFVDIPDYLLAPVIQLYKQGSSDLSARPGPCHCKLDLSILTVEVSDPTLSLEMRWFVDYNPAVPRFNNYYHLDPLDGDFNSASTTRTILTPPFAFDADVLGIVTSGIHVVDVVLAETVAFDSASTSRPNRAIKPGYPSDEHRFVIDVKVDPDPTRQTCPEGLPSRRVCQ